MHIVNPRTATEGKDKTKLYSQQTDKREKLNHKTCPTKTKGSKKEKKDTKNKLGKILNSIMIDIYPSLAIVTLPTNGQLKKQPKNWMQSKTQLCIVHKKPILNMKTAILKLK